MKRWAAFWRAFDQARTIPRTALLAYMWHAYGVSTWFTELKDPSVAQATYVSVVWGVLPLLLSFYMQHGVDWTKGEGGKPT